MVSPPVDLNTVQSDRSGTGTSLQGLWKQVVRPEGPAVAAAAGGASAGLAAAGAVVAGSVAGPWLAGWVAATSRMSQPSMACPSGLVPARHNRRLVVLRRLRLEE